MSDFKKNACLFLPVISKKKKYLQTIYVGCQILVNENVPEGIAVGEVDLTG